VYTIFLEKLLCREWLHKLFKTGKHEESLRNAYLTKLFEQLVKGKLKEPFNNLPKHRSPLLPLRSVSKPVRINIVFRIKQIYLRFFFYGFNFGFWDYIILQKHSENVNIF